MKKITKKQKINTLFKKINKNHKLLVRLTKGGKKQISLKDEKGGSIAVPEETLKDKRIAVLFTIAKMWTQPGCSFMDG